MMLGCASQSCVWPSTPARPSSDTGLHLARYSISCSPSLHCEGYKQILLVTGWTMVCWPRRQEPGQNVHKATGSRANRGAPSPGVGCAKARRDAPPTYFNLIRNLHPVYAEIFPVCSHGIPILSFPSVYVSRHLRHLQPTPLISTALGPVVPLPMQPSSDPCQMRHLSNIAKHTSRHEAPASSQWPCRAPASQGSNG
jgi:hypothetical protein